jgi:hypothetical protein
MLNNSKLADASDQFEVAFGSIKQLVIEKSKQQTDEDVREYWTMVHGGLVKALREATDLLDNLTNPSCNEEVAALFEAFLKRNRFELS